MTRRSKRRAAEAARKAIRLTLQPINEKHKSIRKHKIVHIKKVNSVVPERDGVMIVKVAKPKLRSSTGKKLSIQAAPKQSDEDVKSQNVPLKPASDSVCDQLKKLPDKLMVQLPCGVIRDAAERLKNVNLNVPAGFIIFRTDLRPYNQGSKPTSAR